MEQKIHKEGNGWRSSNNSNNHKCRSSSQNLCRENSILLDADGRMLVFERPQRNAVYWVTPYLVQPALLYSPDHQPRGGAAHSRLLHPHLITLIKKMSQWACLQANLNCQRHALDWDSLFQMGQVDKMLTQPPWWQPRDRGAELEWMIYSERGLCFLVCTQATHQGLIVWLGCTSKGVTFPVKLHGLGYEPSENSSRKGSSQLTGERALSHHNLALLN